MNSSKTSLPQLFLHFTKDWILQFSKPNMKTNQCRARVIKFLSDEYFLSCIVETPQLLWKQTNKIVYKNAFNSKHVISLCCSFPRACWDEHLEFLELSKLYFFFIDFEFYKLQVMHCSILIFISQSLFASKVLPTKEAWKIFDRNYIFMSYLGLSVCQGSNTKEFHQHHVLTFLDLRSIQVQDYSLFWILKEKNSNKIDGKQ